MGYCVQGLRFDPPAGFEPEEVSLSLRAPAPPREARTINKQSTVRPNMELRRRRLEEQTDLATLAMRVIAEVTLEVPDLEAPEQETFSFRDGTKGSLLTFDYPLEGGLCLRQYQAVRLDGDTMSNVILTVDKNTLNDARETQYRDAIASVSVVGAIDFNRPEED